MLNCLVNIRFPSCELVVWHRENTQPPDLYGLLGQKGNFFLNKIMVFSPFKRSKTVETIFIWLMVFFSFFFWIYWVRNNESASWVDSQSTNSAQPPFARSITTSWCGRNGGLCEHTNTHEHTLNRHKGGPKTPEDAVAGTHRWGGAVRCVPFQFSFVLFVLFLFPY